MENNKFWIASATAPPAQAKGGVIAPQALEKDRKAKYVGKNIRGKTVLG